MMASTASQALVGIGAAGGTNDDITSMVLDILLYHPPQSEADGIIPWIRSSILVRIENIMRYKSMGNY